MTTAPPLHDPQAALLDVRGISIAFGGLKAVQDFSLQIPRGGLYGLIGPNGAGKTTAFNLLTGVYLAQTGSVTLGGTPLLGKKPHEIAAAGLSRTFQNIRLFQELSALDNVRIACHMRACHSTRHSVLRSWLHRREEAIIRQQAMHLLDIFDLADRAHEQAKNLPYGDQRRLEIARALATSPKVLLLDEPAAGMNPQEKVELRDLIRRILGEFNLAILLIEHDMGVVMELCSRITVLDHGCTIAHGTPDHVQRDPKVIEAYLGVATEAH